MFLVTKLPGIHGSLSSVMKKRLFYFTFSLLVSNYSHPFWDGSFMSVQYLAIDEYSDKIFHAASNMQGSRYILPPITKKEISQHSLLLLQFTSVKKVPKVITCIHSPTRNPNIKWNINMLFYKTHNNNSL